MSIDLDDINFRSVKTFLNRHRMFLLASIIALAAVYIRFSPAENMDYLQAMDSYIIYRFSQHIALDWSFPALDFFRYFPYAFPTYAENIGSFYIPAILYWLGPFLFLDYLTWAQLFPPLMGGLSVIAIYFIGKEAFDPLTGVSAAFFLATIAGVMHRSGAGFFQKDPISAAFMLVSIYFFIRAWKRNDWYSGIGAGAALGVATISWGGSSMLWLLYALTVGVMLWINEDIRKLVTAYTPTILIGAFLAASLNHDRFWLSDVEFLGNIAVLGFLWSRYLVEELGLVKEENLVYYTPTISSLGLVAVALSPIYSQTIANNFVRLIGYVTGEGIGSSVIGGTVAENTPVTLGELSSQLGSVGVSQVQMFVSDPYASIISPFTAIGGLISNINGPWPLAFIGIVFLSTSILFMVLRKLEFVEETINERMFYRVLAVILVVWTGSFSLVFDDPTPGATLIAVGPAVFALAGSLGILYSLEEFRDIDIEIKWYQIILVLWAVSNILAASAQSRLVFLASYPTAFMAGYMFAKVVRRIRDLGPESIRYLSVGSGVLLIDITLIVGLLISGIGIIPAVVAVAILNGLGYIIAGGIESHHYPNSNHLSTGLLVIIVIVTVLVNFGSGYSAANSLQESPDELWMENLDYLNEEADEDAVVLSWWDYGYHFQSVGRTATVADGGNLGYYTDEDRIPYTIADFFTSENPEEHEELFKKHSVDYLVLDETMLGKYSAVSQIAERDNENFRSMIQLESPSNIQEGVTEIDNRTMVEFSGQGINVYTPVDNSEGSAEITSAPIFESPEFRGEIDCVLTDDGVQEFDGDGIELDGFGEVCAAQNPYFNVDRALAFGQQGFGMPARLVLVPKDIKDHTMVRLYLMDGYDIDFLESAPDASNDYIKTWEVDYDEL